MNKNVTVALGSFILLSSFVYAKSNLCEHVYGRIQETTKSSWLKVGAYMTYEQLCVWSMHNETDYMTWNITRLEDDIADLHLISHGINVTDGNVTLTTGEANLTINVSTREVINCSDPSYVGEKWPFWIEQNVTWGSEIDIWYGTSIISKDEQIHILGEERDCWVVEYNWTTPCMKRWYDKTSGIVLKIHVILYHENITIATTETAILTNVDLPVYRSVHNLDTRLNYTTIQEAIDANETSDGHTISVEEGTYYESVVVNKSISLIGENRDTTIIDCNKTGDVIEVRADNVTISGFTIRNGDVYGWHAGWGVYIRDSSGCRVSGNNVTDNKGGICVEYGSSIQSANCTIRENTVNNNFEGISLYRSDNCTITGNNVKNGRNSGIYLFASSRCTITGNQIRNTQNYGIYLRYLSNNNTIYHNTFINNGIEASISDSLSRPRSNVWDNGLEGNYWSNYTGVDLDPIPDGIGDSPHIINEDNEDNYPLMGMFHDFTVEIGYQQFEHVHVISNSTVLNLEGVLYWLTSPNEYFQVGQPFIGLYVTGEEGGVGFCRIMTPRVVLNDSYVVLVWWEFELGAWKLVKIPSTELPISNSTHAYLYFTYIYPLVMHEIMITIPEFPSIIILPLFMLATLLAVIVYKERAKSDRFYKEIRP